MNVSEIFLNSVGRVRSGWRFLIFFALFFVAWATAGAVLILLLSGLQIGAADRRLLEFTGDRFISFVCAVLLGWLCGKILEGLPFRALGVSFSDNWLKHLLFGLALGALTVLFAVLIALIFGELNFQINQTTGVSGILLTLVVSLVIFTAGAAFEEALFRGYMLQTFSRARLSWFAILLTSLFFGAAHLRNPNVSYFAVTNTALAGVWFSVAYLKTRTLWLPFALHLTWNWVQGAFLGIPVSGITEITAAPIFQSSDAGPAWLTGGSYGIEGGAACTIALVVSTLLIWFLPIFQPTETMLALSSEETSRGERDLSAMS